MKSRRLAIANLAVCVGLLAAGLWPFQFFPENNVKWLPDGKGISVGGRGIVFSSDLFNVANRNSPLSREDSLSLEMAVEALAEPRHVAHILSVYGPNGDEKFIIGQWNSLLLFQAKNIVGTSTVLRKLGVTDGLPVNQARVLTITSSAAGTNLYLDGRLEEASTHQFLKSDSLAGRLVLGNSERGKGGWSGNLYGLALYNRALNPEEAYGHYQCWRTGEWFNLAHEKGILALYPLKEGGGNRSRDSLGGQADIVIPSYFAVLNKKFLAPPSEEYFPNWGDIALNIVAFVPLGLLFFPLIKNLQRYSPAGCGVRTIMFGALISLTIELIQVYIPGRSSSLTDLVTNSVGTAIGVFVYRFALQSN